MVCGRLGCLARRHVGWILLGVVIVGCGPSGKFETYPATGKVVFSDGKPLTGGTVMFKSEDQKVSARGPITEDGTFTLGTNAPGDGAVTGWHGVSIMPPTARVDVDDGGYRSPIDMKFQNAQRSGLRYEVTPDGENHFEITVTPPAAL